jgi:uncharacterized protein (DUF2252 family)
LKRRAGPSSPSQRIRIAMSIARSPLKANHSVAERLAMGKALRQRVPRSAHSLWSPAPDRPDTVAMLESSSEGRVPELIPIRYGRMLPSPLAFLRGSAAIMAFDLAATPTTGIRVQLCGDCHLLNFGAFATPERNFVFDLMDFDETLPGPWEWDVKRLAASVFVAGCTRGFSKHKCKEATLACARSYRERMRSFATMHALDLWYARIDGQVLLDLMRNAASRPQNEKAVARPALPYGAEHLIPKITEVVDGHRRFRDQPPLIYHPPRDNQFEQQVRQFLARYRETLQNDRRTLLSRYQAVDLAMKVVGVGSVGTRCAILLLMADDDDALILQYKEAGPSVLERFAGKSKYRTHGQRVVCGQRMLQSASDIFLGWSSDEEKRDFYFRQLRDMKTSVRLELMSAADLLDYATICGWALARGHAKSGDPAMICGYLGRSDSFDRAVTEFAQTYGDQTESDHQSMITAVHAGRLVAEVDARR